MIQYVKVADSPGKVPVSVRISETGRKEYCFGLSVWNRSITAARAEFLKAQSAT